MLRSLVIFKLGEDQGDSTNFRQAAELFGAALEETALSGQAPSGNHG